MIEEMLLEFIKLDRPYAEIVHVMDYGSPLVIKIEYGKVYTETLVIQPLELMVFLYNMIKKKDD